LPLPATPWKPQPTAAPRNTWAGRDFDAVVLDLGLPVVDGLTVLRHWRASGRGMPVLILTARSAWHEKVMGMDAGADDYLAKPFHMEELLARLRALLRRLSPAAAPNGSAAASCWTRARPPWPSMGSR
jgi:DNA-binding response OmpR family regulator